MSIVELTTFFGWCTVISMSLLGVTGLCLAVMRPFISGLHTRLYGVPRDQLDLMYFAYMANFKLLILVFNLVPYCALKILV